MRYIYKVDYINDIDFINKIFITILTVLVCSIITIVIFGLYEHIYCRYSIISKKIFMVNKKITNDTIPILHNKIRNIIELKIKKYNYIKYGATNSINKINNLINEVKKSNCNSENRILIIDELIYGIDNKSVYIYVLCESDENINYICNVFNFTSLYEN